MRPSRRKGDLSIFDPKIIRQATLDSLKKLDPRIQAKNPVMFVVEVGSVVTTIDQSFGTASDQQIAGELLRQSLAGRAGLGVPGVGLSDGTQLQTGFGAIALPAACPVIAGFPAMQTQVLP